MVIWRPLNMDTCKNATKDLNKQIAVLGSNGFIGGNISNKIINCTKINRGNYSNNIDCFFDYFINAAGFSSKLLSEKDPIKNFDINVKETLKSILDFKFNTYIYLSTCEVYGDISDPENTKEDNKINVSKLSNYGLSKYLAECIVQKYCKKWLILRLNGVIGKNLKKGALFDLMNDGKLWISEESKFQFIHTDYISDLIKLLIDRDVSNEIINVTGMDSVSIKDTAILLEKAITESPYHPIITHRINLDKANSYIEMLESVKSLKLLKETKN